MRYRWATEWLATLKRWALRPAVLSAVILLAGVMPLLYEKRLLGRRLADAMEMLYAVVLMHIILFVISRRRNP